MPAPEGRLEPASEEHAGQTAVPYNGPYGASPLFNANDLNYYVALFQQRQAVLMRKGFGPPLRESPPPTHGGDAEI